MTFDITDGRNRYAPCPKCGATLGMGLTLSRIGIAVECLACEFRGPESHLDPHLGWTPEVDRTAFDGWNAIPRVAAHGQSEPTADAKNRPPA